ncbi:uncharacterized protein [Battus philenor]|uniref:uncharacterized protein n=1 Tax=Battus philenor TaxID=42288 RepID=UPI0035CFC35B
MADSRLQMRAAEEPRYATIFPIEVLERINDITADELSRAEFHCTFLARTALRVLWTKDGLPIETSWRVRTSSIKQTFSLTITPVHRSDYGLYTIICSDGKHKILLKAALNVRPFRGLHYNNGFLYSDHPLSENIAIETKISNVRVRVGERLIFRFSLQTTSAEKFWWYRSDIELTFNRRIAIVQDQQSSSLMVLRAQITDSGLYHVVVKTTKGFASSFAYAIVTNSTSIEYDRCSEEPVPGTSKALEKPLIKHETLPCLIYPEFKLLQHLDSVIAYFGSRILLKCSFYLREFEYYHVVWHVGKYKIQRTNHRFHVISNGGDFYLLINRLEPDMAGIVTCELHHKVLPRKDVTIFSTSSMITVVPPTFFDDTLVVLARHLKKVYYKTIHRIPPSTPQQQHPLELRAFQRLNIDNRNRRRVRGVNGEEVILDDPIIMEVDYCRVNLDCFCYLNLLKEFDPTCRRTLTLTEKPPSPRRHMDCTHTVVFKWEAAQPDILYSVEYLQPNGQFTEVGKTSSPEFEVLDPPLEKVLTIRVKAVEPISLKKKSNVCIIPLPENPPMPQSRCELKSFREYQINYFDTNVRIGKGAFGDVVIVKKYNGQKFAAKIISTNDLKRRDAAYREFDITRRLKHPKVLELVEGFMGLQSFVLVMTYAWGGNLYERFSEGEHAKESDVVQYVQQICEALEYIHLMNIVHLDVKPENIVCMSPNSKHIKLVDFGLSRILHHGRITKALYGTKEFLPPEVLNNQETTVACDMWSFGVTVYLLLSGVSPFNETTWRQCALNIAAATYNYDNAAFKDVSSLAKAFVDRLLVLNPAQRLTASAALQHEWIKCARNEARVAQRQQQPMRQNANQEAERDPSDHEN